MTPSELVLEDKNLVYFRNPVAVAKYKLTAIQQKVFIEVALMAKKDPKQDNYRLYIRDFLKTIGTSTNDLVSIKMQVEEMTRIPIVIEKTKKGGTGTGAIFAFVERFEDNPKEYIEIEIAKGLKPYFIEFAEGEYFKYEIRNTRKLKSVYSIRLYLFLKSWRRIGKVTVGYDELRTIAGVEESEYKLFGDFHKRVIKAAYDELKDKTDLKFEYTLERKRRKSPNSPVNKIVFRIDDNGDQQITIPLDVDPDKELIALAKGVDLTEYDLSALIAQYGRDRVYDGLLLALDQVNKSIPIKSPIGFLHTAIGNGSATAKAKVARIKKQQQKALLESKAIEALIHKGIDDFKRQYMIEIGKYAPQEQKDSFFKQVQEDIAIFPALLSAYKINDEWNSDAFRQSLGVKLNTKTDDELAMMYMKSIGKPVVKEIGLYHYIQHDINI